MRGEGSTAALAGKSPSSHNSRVSPMCPPLVLCSVPFHEGYGEAHGGHVVIIMLNCGMIALNEGDFLKSGGVKNL